LALAAERVAVFVTAFRGLPASTTPPGRRPWRPDRRAELYEARRQRSPDTVVAAITEGGGRAASLEADLADPATIPRIFDACERRLGPVEVLVNDHAHCEYDTFDRPSSGRGLPTSLIDVAGMDGHYAVNARATALMTFEFAKRHIERGATWDASSTSARTPPTPIRERYPMPLPSTPSNPISRSAAHELGKYGITVNVVAPDRSARAGSVPMKKPPIAQRTPLRPRRRPRRHRRRHRVPRLRSGRC